MSNHPPDAWQRLGGLLRSRRAHLDPRYRNRGTFCEETGLNYKLVQEIEGASRTNFTDESFAVFEKSYRLIEGSIRRTLAGGPLEPLGQAPDKSLIESPVSESSPPPAASVDLETYVGQTPLEKAILKILRDDRKARSLAEQDLQRQLRELNDKVDRLTSTHSDPGNGDNGAPDERQLGA